MSPKDPSFIGYFVHDPKDSKDCSPFPLVAGRFSVSSFLFSLSLPFPPLKRFVSSLVKRRHTNIIIISISYHITMELIQAMYPLLIYERYDHYLMKWQNDGRVAGTISKFTHRPTQRSLPREAYPEKSLSH